MIKINLLPQKRARLKAAALTSEPGSRDFFIGIGAIAAAALVVFFAVDRPKRSRISELRDSIEDIDKVIVRNKVDLKGYDEMKAAATEASKRVGSINKLNSVKVVPANVLQELGDILTQAVGPTMTQDMALKTGNNGDPNKRFDTGWDPSHVWLTSFTDKDGEYKIEGGAQSKNDITQLSKRFEASAYFGPDVALPEYHVEQEKESGISYYKFTMTGKVAY
jgi:gas vesicle protein